MNYYCICMAPALDVTIELDRDPGDGEVIKNVRETIVPGGKGLNVARYLAARGAKVSCGGVLGREGESYFKAELKKYGIRNLFSRYDGAIRRNEMIVAPSISYKLNRPAYADLDEFEIDIPERACANTVAIISGSLPKNFKPDYYARLIKRMRSLGYAKIVLDASGAPLREVVFGNNLELQGQLAIEAQSPEPRAQSPETMASAAEDGRASRPATAAELEQGENCSLLIAHCSSNQMSPYPDVIKPNAEECAELVGFDLKTDADFIKATEILNKKIPYVIISDGGKGAWFNGQFVPAPKVDVRDTTAAGDTLLAEFCFSGNPELAVQAGSQACAIVGSEPPVEWIEKLG